MPQKGKTSKVIYLTKNITKDDKLISIILPVYNGEQYLAESIESVLAQTYQYWELLILDDCSTDKTQIISKEFEKRDNRIKYYRNEKNLKLPGNLNRGFSLSKGSYLTWTSDDNRFRSEALEVMVNSLLANKADLTYASYQVIDENDNDIEIISADQNPTDHILGSNVVGACFMYTRKAYESTGDYDTELFWVEVFDYWQRMIALFKPIPINNVLYDYRWHESSLTSTRKKDLYGKRLEEMLSKNRKLYGRLNTESSYYYYRLLKKCSELQNKPFQYKTKFKIINLMYSIKHLPERVSLRK